MDKVGKEGVITVEDGSGLANELDVVGRDAIRPRLSISLILLITMIGRLHYLMTHTYYCMIKKYQIIKDLLPTLETRLQKKVSHY